MTDHVKKTALVLGSTGLCGSLLVKLLVENPEYGCVKLFVRRPHHSHSDKIKIFQGDLLHLDVFAADFTADEVFICIGSTKSKTPNQESYHAIDFGIPVAAAKLAKANGIKTIVVISALGANAKSSIFYNRTKGEMEQALLEIGIEHTYILRPSLIVGPRKEFRFGERIAAFIISIMEPIMLGSLKKYRKISAQCIAKAMIHLADEKGSKSIIESDDIKQLCKEGLVF